MNNSFIINLAPILFIVNKEFYISKLNPLNTCLGDSSLALFNYIEVK